MLVVVVDTATPAVTAALVRVDPVGVTLLSEQITVNARAHGERLAPAISLCLDEVGARPRDLAAVVAGLGPGPFTGLRVGLVTAAAMGQALGVACYGVCSLDGVAGAVEDTDAGVAGPFLVATDALRKEVYWAVYDQGRRLTDPAVDRPETLPEALDRLGVGAGIPTFGHGAVRYRSVLGDVVRDEAQFPSAYAMARCAADRIRGGAPSEALTPMYLRRPDAVESSARKSVSQPTRERE